jgi:hypothetical protein
MKKLIFYFFFCLTVFNTIAASARAEVLLGTLEVVTDPTTNSKTFQCMHQGTNCIKMMN